MIVPESIFKLRYELEATQMFSFCILVILSELLVARGLIAILKKTCERLLLKLFTLDKNFSKSNYKDIFRQTKVSERFLKEENNK